MRELKNREFAFIDSQLKKHFGTPLKKIRKKGVLLTVEKGKREVYLANRKTFNILEKIRNLYFAGLLFGVMKKNRFQLEMEGASLIAPDTKNRVVLTRKGEQIVLYGRDVFLNLVKSYPPFLKKGQLTLLVNTDGEALAVGRVEKKKVFIKNIMDRGLYLRKGE